MNDPPSNRKQLPTLSRPSALPLPVARPPRGSSTLGSLDAALERLFAQPLGQRCLLASSAIRPPVDEMRQDQKTAITADDSITRHAGQSVVEPRSGGLCRSDAIGAEDCLETGSGNQADLDETAASDTATFHAEMAAADGPAAGNADSAAATQTAADADAAERRAFPRRDSGSKVSIHRPKDQAAMTGQETSWLHHASRLKGSLLDVSMSGAALRMAEPLDQGEVILLRLSNRQFDVSVDKKATVLRCSPDGEGAWKIVCKYDGHLAFEQVDVLGKGLFNSRLV